MWRFIEGANGKSKQQHALWVKEHLEALGGVVPEILSLECWSAPLMMPTQWSATRCILRTSR